jgi:hypothetical protein
MDLEHASASALDLDAIAQYRREGFLIVRNMLSLDYVGACLAALAALASDLC